MVEELLRGFIHEPWVDELDFTTLETYPASLVRPAFNTVRFHNVNIVNGMTINL